MNLEIKQILLKSNFSIDSSTPDILCCCFFSLNLIKSNLIKKKFQKFDTCWNLKKFKYYL